MSSKTWEELWWVSFVVLAVWTANGVLVFFLLSRVDSIVNVQLYNYGLQFSNEWADAYWASTRLMAIFLGLPMALNTVVFALGFSKFRKKASGIFSKKKTKPSEAPVEEKTVVTPVEVEPEPLPVAQVEPTEEVQLEVIQPIEPEVIGVDQECVEVEVEAEAAEVETSQEPKPKENVALVISCPKCGKVFNRPLVILDFSKGTTRLVNVCPFCNQILD